MHDDEILIRYRYVTRMYVPAIMENGMDGRKSRRCEEERETVGRGGGGDGTELGKIRVTTYTKQRMQFCSLSLQEDLLANIYVRQVKLQSLPEPTVASSRKLSPL